MLKYLLFFTVVTYVSCISPKAIESLIGYSAKISLPNFNTDQQETVPIAIVSQDSQVNPEEGTFKWSYETADGTKVEQTGEVDPLDKDHVKSIEGSYSYLDPEGKTHEVRYIANDHGFFPTGDDIAPEIIKHLEFIATQPLPVDTKEST